MSDWAEETNYIPPPRECLAELMEEKHITVSELANLLHWPESIAKAAVRHYPDIDPELAVPLEEALELNPEFWKERHRIYINSLKRTGKVSNAAD